MVDSDDKFVELRRSRRTRLTLRGRYLLSDGGEHPCQTIDVSVTGIAISSYFIADLGERVIVYLDELGRIEGVVARRGADWFAIEAKIAPSRIDRLAQKLAALSGDAELRDASGLATQEHTAELRTEFGQSFIVRLCNQTRFGARVVADFQLLPGARVKVDQRSAVVARDASDGFLINYDCRFGGDSPKATRLKACATIRRRRPCANHRR